MITLRKNIWFLILTSFAMVWFSGCVEGGEEDDPEESGLIVAKLQQADSCDDLLTKIQQDAVAKIKAMAEQQRSAAEEYRTYFEQNSNGSRGAGGAMAIDIPNMAMDAGVSFDTAAFPVGETTGTAPPMQVTPGGTAGAAASWDGNNVKDDAPMVNAESESPVGHSDTNVQVQDVDEADIVKVEDGTIYLLHGNKFFVVNAWPAADLSLGPDLEIEGSPVEMFVQDGRAVVYSRVYDNGELGSNNGNNYNRDTMYYGGPYPYCGGGAEFTKISLIDVSGDAPSVVRELYIEGSYQSGRLHGSMARTVVQGGFKAPGLFQPDIEFFDAWGRPYEQDQIDVQIDTWRDLVISSVRSTDLSDWLPLEKERVGGKIVDVDLRCSEFYAPSPGMTEYGLTNIIMLDITQDDGPLSGASILGSVSEVYASENTMLLAHHQWYADGSENDEGQRTALHSFALTADETNYTASGFVPGHILNQFSMDVDDETGVIRLATTKETWNAASRFDNRVITLRAVDNELEILGKSEALGDKDERIFSTRFIGDKGYVVTFEQHDPLIVLDLSNPENLKVLGEAVIPGFSDYMHPLDENHLLTIGRNTDEWGNDKGLMLQIFDVSEPTKPNRIQYYTYDPDGYSEANYNHKAFTYWAEHNLLAIPFVKYGGEYYDEETGTYGWSIPSSSLEVFRVSTETGFEKLGAVDHTALMQQNGCLVKESYYDDFLGKVQDSYYWNCSQPEVRRGIFMDNFVYAISYAGVTVHDLSDLDNSIGQFVLPQPNESTYCYGYDYVDSGWGISIGGMGGMPVATSGSAGVIAVDAPPMGGTVGDIGAGGSSGGIDVDQTIEADAGMAEEGASQ